MKYKNAYSELVPLFGVALIIIVITQTLNDLNASLVSLIAISYIAANSIISALLGILSFKRFIEHTLIAAVVWVVLTSLI